jgi:hypothetical protein
MRLVLLLGMVALATGCSSTSQTFQANGVSVRYPSWWHATAAPLTPVTSPVQVLAVASYPLPHDDRGAEGCMPKPALEALPPDGAFIYGWEYSSPQGERFQPKPKHFALTNFAGFECLGPSYVLHFRQAGRFFQVHVALGPQASAYTRATVLRVLDSFRAKAGTLAR